MEETFKLYNQYFPVQVAAQQGAYLCRCFNRRDHCTENPEGPRRFKSSGRHQFLPFRYACYSYPFYSMSILNEEYSQFKPTSFVMFNLDALICPRVKSQL